MIDTNCGCSPTNGACAAHKTQNELVSSVAGAVTEADEVAMVNESLARAIAYLGAVEVAPNRYAFHVHGAPCWYVVAESALEAYGEEWDAIVRNPVAMPSWWTPEKRFAFRQDSAIGPSYSQQPLAHLGASNIHVTADLETGAEVPA